MSGSPLYPLLSEINKAATSGMPFLAVAMTVALPDICVSLVSEDGRSDRERYVHWCDANLGPRFSLLTGRDLYSMRCGVLHNGRFGDLKHSFLGLSSRFLAVLLLLIAYFKTHTSTVSWNSVSTLHTLFSIGSSGTRRTRN